MYHKIVNPITGRKVNTTGPIGRKIQQNYLYKLNRYSLKGGGKCKGDTDCSTNKGRKTICNSKSDRCVLADGKAGKGELVRRRNASSSKKSSPKRNQTSAKKTKVKKMINKGKTVHPKLLKAPNTRVPNNKAVKKVLAKNEAPATLSLPSFSQQKPRFKLGVNIACAKCDFTQLLAPWDADELDNDDIVFKNDANKIVSVWIKNRRGGRWFYFTEEDGEITEPYIEVLKEGDRLEINNLDEIQEMNITDIKKRTPCRTDGRIVVLGEEK